MKRYVFFIALILVVLFASPAAAGDVGRFWSGFKSFWSGMLGSVSGVVGIALFTGIIAIFIITRGKWIK